MGSRLTIACVSLIVLLVVHPAARGQQNPYRLKEADQKKACLVCHTDFEQTLKKRYVHAAVRAGNCSGCHDPHVSSHGKLLSGNTREVCAACHDKVIVAAAKSVHQVVVDGACGKCHDPHASDNPGMLRAGSDELCFGCHKDVAEGVKSAKFRHRPVGQGCLSCHDPHSSSQSAGLLKSAVPALCVNCHKPNTPAFQGRHMNYPVARASCTSCHDPHGSNQPALLLNNVHAPLTGGACGQCHPGATSPSPFATKKVGFELCRDCHGEMVGAAMAKRRLHWPVADKKGCMNCHSPHAAKQDKLLRADTAGLCGSCHADTLKRIAATPVKHAPVAGATCMTCHSPHGAEAVHLLDPPSIVKLCTACHDYEQHSAHPIGEKAVDPRNKNLRVDCLSCHNGHGTEFKRMLLAATNIELCTRCHKKYAR